MEWWNNLLHKSEGVEEENRGNINKTISLSNLCRCIYVLLYGSKLKEGEDFYVTTSAGGMKNYHVKVNEKTLKAFKIFASI